MTDDELVKNSVTFIFAGTHTTSTSIAFSLLELANHPDIQQRLFDIVAPFKDENGFLDPDKCPPESLEFARAIFNESIRLWPPAFAVGMAARKPATIQGKKVPESTRVVIPVGALVRDERYFKDPDKFDPDRWGDLEKSNPGLSALCFGGGARVCPVRLDFSINKSMFF
jgi:cytochrome P450